MVSFGRCGRIRFDVIRPGMLRLGSFRQGALGYG